MFARWFHAGFCGAAVCLAAPLAAQTADPTIMVVFDGSGSMWGRLPGSPNAKFQVARDALRSGLAKLGSDTRVGLTAFGHRRQGDCSDVELMLPVDKLDAGRIAAPLDRLNPKGRGPIATALREGAKSLANVAGPASLILVHDDPDNCQQDPCAAAAEIKAGNPRLAIHVVALGLRREDAARMSCVAGATGGRLFEVEDAGAAAIAIDEALRLATSGRGAPTIAKAPAPRPAVRGVAPDGPPGLILTAVLMPGGEVLTTPTHWRIFRDGTDAPLAEGAAAEARIQAAPGTYLVEARQGLAQTRQRVEIGAKGPTLAAIPLSAGALQLSAPLHRRGEPHPDVYFTISEVGAGASPTGRIAWLGRAPDQHLVLPAGQYRIAAQLGLARQEKTVVVPAGTRSALELPLAAGRLRLKAIDREGGATLDQVLFSVTEDDPDGPQGRKEVARSAAVQPEFTLPTGTYYVAARQGATEVKERVLVGPGDLVQRTLVLGLARLEVTSSLAGSPETPADQVSYRVYRLEGEPQVAARSGQSTARFELAAGRYRIEGQLGSQNARAVRDVELRPGAEHKVALEHQAASVRLRIADAAGGPTHSDVFWDLRDHADRPVWRTVQAEPTAYLAAGRYRLRVEARERRYESQFELKSGETRIIEITGN